MRACLLIASTLLVAAGGCAESSAPSSSSATTPPSAPTSAPVEDVTSQTLVQKLNLNTASEDAFLSGVPGLTHKMAHEFEEYRPYISIEQFRKQMAKYVDADTIAGYEQHVFVPIDPSECDAATLRQIPGITAEIADALIAGRPYATNDAFLAALKTHVAPEHLAAAGSYLATP